MNTLIDEIFDNYYAPIKLPENNREGLKSELLKAIMECKPGTALADSNLTDKEWSEYEGYVKGITHWENNIKALFGENKENKL